MSIVSTISSTMQPPRVARGAWRRQFIAGALVLLALAPVAYRLSMKSPAAAAAGDGGVLIQFMAWGNPEQLDCERAVIAKFNEHCKAQGKNITVELFMPPVGGYPQKSLMMLASGTAPDTLKVDNYYFPSLAAKGYFYDLTDIAKNDPTFHADDFHPVPMRENLYRGRLYGLNCVFGGLVCYYNKDMFRQAGLADPYDLWKQGKWTWAAFDDACERLSRSDDSGRQISFGWMTYLIPNGPIPQSAILWLWREGGDFLSPDFSRCVLDSPASLRGMQRLRDDILVRHVCPSPAQLTSNVYAFEAGNVAIDIENCGMTPRFRAFCTFDWDIAPTPCDAGNSFTQTKGNQLVVPATCKHPLEAWEWVKFYTSEETELYLCGDRFRRSVPTRIAVLRDPRYLHADRPPFHTDVFVDVVERGRGLPVDEAWNVWTTDEQRYVDRMITQPNVSTEELMGEATRAINEDLAREHARYARYRDQRVSDAE